MKLQIQGTQHDSGLRKFGAILGDNVSVGCNSVTNPGTMVGKNTLAYAIASLQGIYPPNSIIKVKQQTTLLSRQRGGSQGGDTQCPPLPGRGV